MEEAWLSRIKGRLGLQTVSLLLATIGFIIYANALPNQMFWDDFDNILNNRFVQEWRYFPKLFTENIIAGVGLMSNYWRPLLMTVFSLEWHLFGNWAAGYHFVNAALHIANAILLFYILKRILGNSRPTDFSSAPSTPEVGGETPGVFPALPAGRWRGSSANWLALLTSLIFLVHPAQTEAITYVSSLADPLSTFFIFSGILLFLKFCASKEPLLKSPPYLLSLIAYCLALMTKEAAIVMPAFIFIIDFLFQPLESKNPRPEGLKNRLWSTAKRLWPFFTIAAIYILLRATVLNFGGTFNLYGEEKNILTENLHVRLFTFFRVLVEYFKILFWPANLHAERTVEIATSLLYLDVAIGGLIFVGLLAAAFYLVGSTLANSSPASSTPGVDGETPGVSRRGSSAGQRTILSFGILWFFIGLAPVSNIAVPINNLIMEHWLYLPVIGIALIFVWLGMLVAERWVYLQKPLLGLFAVALILLSIKTINRNKDWRDPITFYNQTLQYAPNSYRIINNLGMAYADVDDHTQAEATYKRAIETNPTNPVAYHNLGNTYRETGRKDQAIESFYTAIELDPEFVFSYNALASLYLEEENYQEVRRVFESYLDYGGSKVDTLFLLAQIAVEEGDLQGALIYLEEALAIDPENQAIQTGIAQLEDLIESKE